MTLHQSSPNWKLGNRIQIDGALTVVVVVDAERIGEQRAERGWHVGRIAVGSSESRWTDQTNFASESWQGMNKIEDASKLHSLTRCVTAMEEIQQVSERGVDYRRFLVIRAIAEYIGITGSIEREFFE